MGFRKDLGLDRNVEKRCSKCHLVKLLDDFGVKSEALDKRQSHCLVCNRAHNKLLRVEHKSQWLAYMAGTGQKPRRKHKASGKGLQSCIGVRYRKDLDLDRNVEKRCSTCHLVKPLDAFYLRSASIDGRHCLCRVCNKARNHRVYVEHRVRWLAYMAGTGPKPKRRSPGKAPSHNPRKFPVTPKKP